MEGKDVWPEFRCFGSATVGPRGQVVIPASARKELGIDAGATLLVFIGPGKKGVVLLKADAVGEMVSMMSKQLASFETLVKDYRSPKAKREK